MSLKNQVEKKLNQALKEKDKNTYPTLRLIVSAIKDAEIANRSKEKKDLFSRNYKGQFSYSSAFKISKNKTNTLHSLFGKCKVSKGYISK